MADLPLHLADMQASPPWESTRDWLDANELFRNEVLDILDADGPLLSRDIHASAQVPWRSSGWNADRNVRMMLECLLGRGEVAINGRQGNQRLWDLAERVYPAGRRARAARGGARRSATSAGSAVSGSPAPRARSCPASRSTSATPASRPSSRASAASGGSTPRCSDAPFRGPDCAVVAVRRDRARPQADGGPLRVRLRPGDVQAGRGSGGGATSPSRSCTATGWSASSTPPPTARRAGSSSTRSTRTCRSRRP